MSAPDFVKLALQMATMLAFALVFGEIMRRLRQPAVVGEMFGGIVLGPTIFGWLAPALYEWLFLSSTKRDRRARGVHQARHAVLPVLCRSRGQPL